MNIGIDSWSADDVVDEECRYHAVSDEGWEWKVPILGESRCAYDKCYEKKAGFITQEGWPNFCNYRRS